MKYQEKELKFDQEMCNNGPNATVAAHIKSRLSFKRFAYKFNNVFSTRSMGMTVNFSLNLC